MANIKLKKEVDEEGLFPLLQLQFVGEIYRCHLQDLWQGPFARHWEPRNCMQLPNETYRIIYVFYVKEISPFSSLSLTLD